MERDRALVQWREGEASVGCWMAIANTFTAESLAGMGFDWICLDLQHGQPTDHDLVPMLQAVARHDVTPFVRVRTNETSLIQRALDAGALGVIVPLVSSRAEAERAVAACRYPPRGQRSFGPFRAILTQGREYARQADEAIACIAMIETREALDRLDEILATPGLSGVFIGPADLATAIGREPQLDHPDPQHAAVVEQILAKARAQSVPAGILAASPEFARRYLAAGFSFVGLSSDINFMRRAAMADLQATRSEQPAPAS